MELAIGLILPSTSHSLKCDCIAFTSFTFHVCMHLMCVACLLFRQCRLRQPNIYLSVFVVNTPQRSKRWQARHGLLLLSTQGMNVGSSILVVIVFRLASSQDSNH